jgi:hypothetical protein
MQIDTFLTMGKGHKICEDYILSGTNPLPYIILADGCSSSKATDMGARLLCFLAQQYIRFRVPFNKYFQPNHDDMGLWIIHNAELVGKQLGLPKNALDATLVIAYKKFDSDQVRVHLYGDGCVVHSGPEYLSIKEIQYSKNAPYYLSYKIDIERDNLYAKMHQKKIIKDYIPIITKQPFGYIIQSCWDYDITKKKNCLLIASDGLTSFIKNRIDLIPITDYANELFNFQTTKGEFLKRRINWLLKDLAKNNTYNYDDLSIGAFLLEEEDENYS